MLLKYQNLFQHLHIIGFQRLFLLVTEFELMAQVCNFADQALLVLLNSGLCYIKFIK
jgi:hypothetical protein